jgi:hypothetical protein
MRYEWKVPDIPLFNPELASKEIKNDIAASLDKMTSVLQANIKLQTPRGVSRNLWNNINTYQSELMGRVSADTDYAVVLNEGRRPGARRPPASALVRWIIKSSAGVAWFAKIRAANPRITVRQAAYILARSIGRKGFKNDFFDRGVDQSSAYITKEANDLLSRIKASMV